MAYFPKSFGLGGDGVGCGPCCLEVEAAGDGVYVQHFAGEMQMRVLAGFEGLGQWTSRKASQGLWHKLGSIAAVLVAVMCDIALGVIAGKLGDGFISVDYGCVITPIVAAWYIFTELGSVIENAAKLGAPMPKFLKKLVSGLRDAADDAGDRKGK